MKTLFIILICLVVIFSCAVSGYIAFFKLPFNNKPAKVMTFLATGAVLTATVFVICFAVIWPPVM